MIEIITADFSVDVKPISREELRAMALRLFESWDVELSSLPLPDYAVSFDLEEGSIKGKGRVLALATTVVALLGAAADVPSGIREFNRLVRQRGHYLIELVGPLPPGKSRPRVTAGQMGKVELVLARVHRGEMSVDEAKEWIRLVFDEEAVEDPEIIDTLNRAVDQVPRLWKQLPLFEEDSLPESEFPPKPPRSKKPKPADTPLPEARLAFRVEVYRDSKKGKREVKVITL